MSDWTYHTGDIITFHLPDGDVKMRILGIEYDREIILNHSNAFTNPLARLYDVDIQWDEQGKPKHLRGTVNEWWLSRVVKESRVDVEHGNHNGGNKMKYNVGDEIRFNGTVYRITNIVDDNYVIRDEINRIDFNIPCPTIDIHAIAIKKPVEKPKDPAVDHPSYYQGRIEVIDFIEDKHLGFNLGNCVKYISRAGKKNPDKLIEDLNKARWYLDREIARIEKEK
ncbi:DUF3310 domain-containing protein [Mitsuokella multacida]|uniref:Protein of unknwon function (DUF3310) n=1 Tax=Mitsuokella multacida DSM 20544 TaxID=500635 RepID=C9KJH6_9FIRM|nr:DUF3310 domain-containing protein [Mitsuokella multacida]EEX70042.1 hypothetical protein MITSMUL_03175 [Mitsuokella multacida DSM 20544]